MAFSLEFPAEVTDYHQGMITLSEVSSRDNCFFSSFLFHVYVFSVCSRMCMHVGLYEHILVCAQMHVSTHGHTCEEHRPKLVIFADRPLYSLRQGLSVDPRAP